MSFPAKYKSLCIPCGETIEPGDEITGHPQVGFIHLHCVESVDEVTVPTGWEATGDDFDSFNQGRSPRPVLPRGKTSKDRCNECFIIHASGQTECY